MSLCSSSNKPSSHTLFIITVIGFATVGIEVTEYPPNEHQTELVLLTPRNVLSILTLASKLDVLVEVNEMLSTATAGSPISTD